MPENEAKPLRQVERDKVAVERGAGLLQRLLVGRAHGEDVVLCGELAEARRRGGLGEEEGAPAEDVQAWWSGDGEGIGDRTGLFFIIIIIIIIIIVIFSGVRRGWRRECPFWELYFL